MSIPAAQATRPSACFTMRPIPITLRKSISPGLHHADLRLFELSDATSICKARQFWHPGPNSGFMAEAALEVSNLEKSGSIVEIL